MADKTYCPNPQCNHYGKLVIPQGGKCPWCKQELGPQVDSVWRRTPLQVAVRLGAADFGGFLERGMDVPEGSRALLFKGGALEQILWPGHHVVASLGERIANYFRDRQVQVVLVDDGEIEMEFEFGRGASAPDAKPGPWGNLFSADQLPLAARCAARVAIDTPALFATAMMPGRNEVTREQLRNACGEELATVLQSELRRQNVADLHGNEALRQEVERAVEKRMGPWFDNRGIRIVKLFVLEVVSETREAMRKKEGEVWGESAEQKIAQQRTTLKHEGEVWNLSAAEAVDKKKDEIQKDGLTRKTLRELFESRTEGEKLDILNELTEKRMLNDNSVMIVKRQILEESEDYGLAREFFKNKTNLLQKDELERMRLEDDFDKAKMREALTDLHEDSAHGRLRKETDLHREIKVKDTDVDRDLKLKDAGAQRDIDSGDWDLAHKIHEQRLGTDLREKEEKSRIEREDKLARESNRAKMIAEMSAAGPEALMVWTDDPSRAKMLAELRQTEALKGMSEEQILAMGAKDSSAVADAFKEKFRSMGADRLEGLYKEMLRDKDAFARQTQQMFDKALDAQGGSAVGVAHGAGPKSGWGAGVPGGGTGGGSPYGDAPAMLCPKCNTPNMPNANFCVNCGEKLRGK